MTEDNRSQIVLTPTHNLKKNKKIEKKPTDITAAKKLTSVKKNTLEIPN